MLNLGAVEELLGNWQLLNRELMTLDTSAVRQLIRAEMNSKRREHYLHRLYGRYRKLNLVRERAALRRGDTWPIDF